MEYGGHVLRDEPVRCGVHSGNDDGCVEWLLIEKELCHKGCHYSDNLKPSSDIETWPRAAERLHYVIHHSSGHVVNTWRQEQLTERGVNQDYWKTTVDVM